MNKESIYFSHDADAMNDPKCMLLIEQFGMEGYGVFWGLVEMLRVQPNYKLPIALIPAISKRFSVSEAKVKTIIENYGLFCLSEDSFFFSQSLRDRMQIMIYKQESRKIASQKANEIRWNKVKALQQIAGYDEDNEELIHSESVRSPFGVRSDSDFIQKEKKRKYLKKKEISPNGDKKKNLGNFFTPPEIEEVSEYCKIRKNGIDPEKFIDFYTSKGWMIGKNKMKDWRAAVRTWEKIKNNQNNNDNEPTKRYTEL